MPSASTDLFAHLSEAEQNALAKHLIHAPFAAGDVMTRQGAVAHWLYLIIHGEAKVLVEGPSGPVQLTMLHDGDVFGEMGMLTGEARRATVVAETAVECYRLDKEGFAQVLRASAQSWRPKSRPSPRRAMRNWHSACWAPAPSCPCTATCWRAF